MCSSDLSLLPALPARRRDSFPTASSISSVNAFLRDLVFDERESGRAFIGASLGEGGAALASPGLPGAGAFNPLSLKVALNSLFAESNPKASAVLSAPPLRSEKSRGGKECRSRRVRAS